MMANTPELAFNVRRPDIRRARPAALPIDSHHGPWLFLMAPVSFALVLMVVIYIAQISF